MADFSLFYELSHEADCDIEAIFDYTNQEFGEDQAVSYVRQFGEVFEQLLATPKLGRERDEIRVGLRSITMGNHVVFYRIMSERIRIVRILHASRDLPRFFKQE